MYDISTHDVCHFFVHVWQHRFSSLQLGGSQQEALRVVEAHPEYGPYLEDIERYLDKEWRPEDSEGNPPLHMSLRFSLQEQAVIDQPSGICTIHHRLCTRHGGNWMRAGHEMMDALAEMLWEARCYGRGLDVNAYMTRLRKLIELGSEEQVRVNPHKAVLKNE